MLTVMDDEQCKKLYPTLMEYVADEVQNKVRKLKVDGYDISELITSLNKLNLYLGN